MKKFVIAALLLLGITARAQTVYTVTNAPGVFIWTQQLSTASATVTAPTSTSDVYKVRAVFQSDTNPVWAGTLTMVLTNAVGTTTNVVTNSVYAEYTTRLSVYVPVADRDILVQYGLTNINSIGWFDRYTNALTTGLSLMTNAVKRAH